MTNKLSLFPHDAAVDAGGQLTLRGQRAGDLAAQFGTPLYVYDIGTIRRQIAAYRRGLAAYAGPSQLTYASKAFQCTALARLMTGEDVGLDVASAGEIYIAQQGGAKSAEMHMHGNNKTPFDLKTALDAGVGRIVVDNATELDLLAKMAQDRGHRGQPVNIWLRITPDVTVETHHRYTLTGAADSKFGFSIPEAKKAATCILSRQAEKVQGRRGAGAQGGSFSSAPRHPRSPAPLLNLTGLHVHLGSHFHDVEPVADAVEMLLDLANSLREKYGWALNELCAGGGWGVRYHPADPPMPVEPFVTGLTAVVEMGCRKRGLRLPTLILEPGRSLVGPAGVALYTVGGRKVIPEVRTYVSVDGGLADNPRPALYQAQYTALLANRANAPETERVAIAGPFCESGDVAIQSVALPVANPGDILAVPVAGAYQLAMGSNYNAALKPAVVFIDEDGVKLVQRRETPADLIRRDE